MLRDVEATKRQSVRKRRDRGRQEWRRNVSEELFFLGGCGEVGGGGAKRSQVAWAAIRWCLNSAGQPGGSLLIRLNAKVHKIKQIKNTG